MRLLLSICLLSFLPLVLEGQSLISGVSPPAIDFATVRLSRVARAVATEEKITIDGRLDEAVWSEAEPAKDFTQGGRSSKPGHPASQQTEVRFVYDADNLYIGAICYEKDPASMIVNGLKRDFPGGNLGDEIGIVLDSLNDDRSGFFFSTNPAGAKRDLQVSNDRQINQEWDGVWDVKVRVGDDRWVAEFTIPFKTLRFSDLPSQVWGLNMFRKIRRVNEVSDWTPLPIRDILTRVSLAGTLIGLENIRQGRNLKVKPYVVAGVVQEQSADRLKSNFDGDGGFDLKYGLTQSLTLDATYRTDFSQAEVDQDQVNLTRFNLFFPEKRDFFLENSGVFDFAGGGTGGNLLPFFSRRIGLSESGAPIPIIGGARISGSVGGSDIGFLAMKTDSEGALPSNDFVVGRMKKNLLRNSFIGAVVTNRDSTRPGDYNRVYGTDAVFQFANRLDVTGYFLKSDTPGVHSQEDASRFAAGWRDNLLSFGADYEKVGDNFNPEVGFIRRDDMSHYSGDFTFSTGCGDSTLSIKFINKQNRVRHRREHRTG